MRKISAKSLAVLQAVQRLGPSAKNNAIASLVGIQLDAARGVVSHTVACGFLRRVGKGEARRLYITKKGREGMKSGPARDRKPSMKLKGEPRERPCLMCGETFFSEGIGNSICNRCKSTREWKAGLNEAYTASGATGL